MDEVDRNKRKFLIATTTVIGGAGLAAAAIPFFHSLSPGARAKAGGGPVQVDISKLEPGQQLTIVWRNKPVWVLRRSSEILGKLEEEKLRNKLRDPDSQKEKQQPMYARNMFRSINPEYLVVIGICTHLGCVPTFRPELAPVDLGDDWPGGYFCPCHGSRFDLAGRVFKNVPAPTNLVVPSYRYLSEKIIEIGVDTKTS